MIQNLIFNAFPTEFPAGRKRSIIKLRKKRLHLPEKITPTAIIFSQLQLHLSAPTSFFVICFCLIVQEAKK
jgi:hypothetical protein